MDSISQIKSKLDIVDIIGGYIPLKKSGRNYSANCPFHGEKTPSFMVSPELQIYKCFGCGVNGDMFRFVQEIEGIDFVQTLEHLAEKAGIELERKDYDPTSLKKKKIFEINNVATQFYQQLLKHPAGKEALEYLKAKRKLKDSIIEEFKLGYAPNAYDLLYKYMIKKGYAVGDLLDAGVITKRYSGNGYIDKFRHRIVFPLIDIASKPVGFTARSLDSTEPKYLNSPETLIFHKHTYLYGLDKTKVNIKTEGAVFVEGQMDLIAAYQSGIKNVIASSGTSITPEQLQLLKRYTQDITFCLDSDTAGIKAVYRAVELAEKQNFNIKVAVIPAPYKDLDEVLKVNTEQAKETLKDAVNAYDFFVADKIKRNDKHSAYGKKRIIEELKPILSRISNPVLFETYIKELEKELDIEAKTLEEIIKMNKKMGDIKEVSEPNIYENAKNDVETYFLAILLKADIDGIKAYLYTFDPKEWVNPQVRILLQLLAEFTLKETKFDITKYINSLDENQKTFIKNLYIQDIQFDTKELEETLNRIRKIGGKEKIKRLTEEIKLAEKQKDNKKVENLLKEIETLKKILL